MRVSKTLRLWRRKPQLNKARPQKQPNLARTKKWNSKLVELEREIKAMLGPIRNHGKTAPNKGSVIARFFKGVGDNAGNQKRTIVAQGSNPNPIGAHPISRAAEPGIVAQEKPKAKRQATGKASALGVFLSMC